MVKRQRTWKRKAKAERKSLKMWADGAREDLLRPHIEPYTDALERGWRSERDYLQKVCNQYHTQISWRLADHEEPALPLAPYDPFAPPVAETLTEEEESARHARHKELNQRIRRWLKYRARSLRNKGLSKSALHDSPYAVLLAKLSGVTSPPKARQAFQQLMRERKAEVAAEVDKKWRAESINADGSANTKVPNAPYRCQVARDMFAALPAEEQAAIRARAVAEAQQAKLDYATAMKGGASKSPEARQKCIDGFGRFMAPLMRGLQEYTGLQGFLVMGGPMPKYNGAIQTIHLSVGTNLSAVPATFAGWDKARWNRNVTEYYMEFLRTAYTAEQCAEAALPAPLTLNDARYTMDDFGSDSSSESDSDDSGSSSDSEDSSDTEGKPKKKKPKRAPKKKETKKDAAATKKKGKQDGDREGGETTKGKGKGKRLSDEGEGGRSQKKKAKTAPKDAEEEEEDTDDEGGGSQKKKANKAPKDAEEEEEDTDDEGGGSQKKKANKAPKDAEEEEEDTDEEEEERLARARAYRDERAANIERNNKLLEALKLQQAGSGLAAELAAGTKATGAKPAAKSARKATTTTTPDAPPRRSGRRKAATGDSPTEESGAMDVDDPAAAAGASIGNDGDQDVRMDTADTANAAAGVPTPQMDSEATNGGGLTAPATGAPRPRPRFAGGKKKGIDEREGVAATGGSSNNERDDGGDDAHVSSPSTEKTSSPGGSSNDERGDAPVPSNGASDNASGASQPSLPAMIRSPPRPTLSPATPSATLVAPAPPLATASAPTPSAPPTLVAPPPPLATLSPRPTPPATPSDSEEGQSIRAVCPPKSAPWFEHGFTEVSREDLGARYEELLKAYIDLERGYGFALGTKALKGPDRPSQVQKWIRDGRGRTQAVREIANVDAFEKQWWSWWSGLQPAWRGAWRGQTALPPPPENADWEGLAVPGQNGLLSVVATIYWWGCAEKEKGMSSRSAGWEEAVTDVIWVFRGLTRKGK